MLKVVFIYSYLNSSVQKVSSFSTNWYKFTLIGTNTISPFYRLNLPSPTDRRQEPYAPASPAAGITWPYFAVHTGRHPGKLLMHP